MNYHHQNIAKVCSLCGLASSRLRAYTWKRNRSHFLEVQRENLESTLPLTNLYCKTCTWKYLSVLGSASRPEAVNNAFAKSRIKKEFDHIMDMNRSSIHPKPKKELFCSTCRKGFLEPFSKVKNDVTLEKHVEKLLGQLYTFKGHTDENCQICCEYDIYQRKKGEDSQNEDTAEAEALLPPEDQELSLPTQNIEEDTEFQSATRDTVYWEPGHELVGQPRKWVEVAYAQQLELMFSKMTIYSSFPK